MEPANKIVLLSPGTDNLQSGPNLAWLEQFGANLDLVLKRYTDESLRIISPESKEAADLLAKPVFLILMMHMSYGSSGKLMKFLEKIAEENRDTIVKLLRVDTSPEIAEKTPELFANAPSIELFDSHEETNPSQWFGQEATVYWSRLLDLAAEVSSPVEPAADPAKGDAGNIIYLAQTSADMGMNRNILKRELIEHGFRVMPGADLKIHKTDLKSQVQNMVDQSRLAIHLLGNAYGKPMKESAQSLAEVQIRYITEYLKAIENDSAHTKKKLNRLIWIDPEFNPVDSQQEELINQLKRNIENLHRTEIIQTPIELFKTLIITRLRQKESDVYFTDMPEESSGKFIYLIHALDDQDEAAELAKGLSKGGLTTGMLDYSKDQRNLLNDHKAFLQACDGAIVYYGNSNRPWLQSKVMDLLKAPGLGRTHSLESRQILAGRMDALEDFSMPDAISITREPDISRAVTQLMKNLKQ
jgi:hypothetical protein